jgi:hypothetical protein
MKDIPGFPIVGIAIGNLEYPSSGTLNINDWKAWNILHQVRSISNDWKAWNILHRVRSISTIGKPGISFIGYAQYRTIGKHGISFTRDAQYQRLESLEYPSSGTLNINDWKAWNILHRVRSISTIGKPGISFIGYAQYRTIGKPGKSFIGYAQYQRLESLEYPSSGTLNFNDWKARNILHQVRSQAF